MEIFQFLELREVASEVISELSPSALEKRIELELDAPDSVTVFGNEHLINILITNLLQNAINFTPEHGNVSVCIAENMDGVMLSVEDTGPGIPDNRKAWVFERLNRVSTGGGTGLGLSIVKEISKLHRASISLTDRSGTSGLIVNLFLPHLSKA